MLHDSTLISKGSILVGRSGGTGSLLVDSGSVAEAAIAIDVGTGTDRVGGDGAVTVQGGATLRSDGPHIDGAASIAVADQAGTTGTVTVTGAGSLLDAGGDRISVGVRGTGTLLVADGATATAGDTHYVMPASEAGFSLGRLSGAGAATIDGAGSLLNVDGTITLGGSGIASGGTGVLTASGGGTVDGTALTLWSGGTISTDGASLIDIGTGSQTGAGVVIQSGAMLTAHGGKIEGTVVNAGGLSNDGNLTILGSVQGFGTLLLNGGSTDISGSFAGGISFSTRPASLKLHQVTGMVTVILAQSGDTIDLAGITGATLTGDTVTTATGSIFVAPDGLAPGPGPSLSSDNAGGTLISLDGALCYCPGTRILTDRGERPVETLAVGDRVVTHLGGCEPIRWIGRRSYGAAFIAGNHLMLPVCIKAGALADATPGRDLWVSPGHGLFIDGVLVPAWRLVNGRTVVQSAAAAAEYLHIELAAHDIILAEGAPAESFLDEGGRAQFANAAEHAGLYADGADGPVAACAPRVEDGFHLQAIQRRVDARAGLAPALGGDGALRGFVDVAGPQRVCGWAQDLDAPEAAVCLDVVLEGRRVMRVLANRYRADLRQGGMGSGCHAFDVALPAGLAGCVEVRRSSDHAPLALTEAAVLAGAA